MPTPAARGSRTFSRFISHSWWILLLAALGTLWLATARRMERVEMVTNSPTWSVDAPRRDASSPTGYASGQRRLLVPGHHNPSFWWIMEAQQATSRGGLRLRHVDYDAAPAGRDISRTSPYRWWLIAVGWLHGAFTGEPLGYSIERGALIADPLLLALLLIAAAAYTARYIGAFAAIGIIVGGISLFPLAANFQPGAPDPHSLAWVLALGSVLPLIAFPEKVGPRRRAHFMLAGILGGLGFWNDATSHTPVLLAIFIAGIAGELARGRGARPSLAPSPWRAWAIAGAITTALASAFEFAPDHFSWSLDSVSLLHALIWWGFGEVLHATVIWLRAGRGGFSGGSLALLAGAVGAIAVWPVVALLFSGSGGLLASDFYALELANHPAGGVASGMGAWLNRPGGAGAKWATLLPCVLLLVLLGRIFLGPIERETRGRFVFILAASLFAVVLAHLQLRWWNLVDVFLLAVLAAIFAEGETGGGRARLRVVGAVIVVLPGLFVGFPQAVEGNDSKELSPLEVQALIARDFAYWLGKRSGDEPIVLSSTPLFSGAAAFYGGFKVVASTDEENESGHLTAVRIASTTMVQELSVLLTSLGVTHVALPLWDPISDRHVRAGLNLPPDQPLPESAFAVALRAWDIPLWMRPMDYLIPNQPGFESFELRAFALQSEQEPELGLSRLADFFVQRGQLQEAQDLRDRLAAYPRSVVALGAIANVDLASRDRTRLEASLEALVPYLSRRAARNLPADRRVSFAALFLQTKRTDLAREQLTACFEELDAETLRTLTPGAVVNLVALSRALVVPFPARELEALAIELIPPGIRADLPPK